MTNYLWALLGYFIGCMIGIIIAAIWQIGRESDKDFDRLPSVWVGFVEWRECDVFLVRQVKGYGIDVYKQNKIGDLEHVSRLPHSFTARSQMEEYVKANAPYLTRDEIDTNKIFQIEHEDNK